MMLVVVTWVDSRHLDNGWRHIHEMEDHPDPVHCISCGWVVRKTDAAITLAQNIGDLQYKPQASGMITIPNQCIVSVSTIEDYLSMAANLKKTVTTKVDKATGRTKVTRTATYDASKTRNIAKSKTKRVVAPARAAARGR